jgi:UDP-2,3-diacylglucosamine pyrophosphatase LpxH
VTSAALSDDHDVVLVSDLHMAAGASDPFAADAAFAALLDDLRARHEAAERPLRLVLLGDLLDFTLVEVDGRRLDPSIAGAIARLDRIAAAHGLVFAAFARLTAAGVPVHVVPGNHDLELLAPPVFACLCELLAPAGGHVVLHPWIVHVPGVLYAEHGHQHHDINRVPGLLERYDPAGWQPPAGTLFGELLLDLSSALGCAGDGVPGPAAVARALRRRPARLPTAIVVGARFAAALLRTAAAMSRAARVQRAARHAARARAHAETVGLPAPTLAALATLSATSPARVARRLLRPGRAADYMALAAGRVHATLSSAGAAVPHYVFGHTHVAADRALASGVEAPRYLNGGTWSQLAAAGSARYGYVDVTREAGAVVARLRAWEEVSPPSPAALPAP